MRSKKVSGIDLGRIPCSMAAIQSFADAARTFTRDWPKLAKTYERNSINLPGMHRLMESLDHFGLSLFGDWMPMYHDACSRPRGTWTHLTQNSRLRGALRS